MQIPPRLITALKRLNREHAEGEIVGLLIGAEADGGAWPLTVTVQLPDGERINRGGWLYPEQRRATMCGHAAVY